MRKTLLFFFFIATSIFANEVPIKLISLNNGEKILHGSVVFENSYFESNATGEILVPQEALGKTVRVKAPGYKKGAHKIADNRIFLEEFHPKALYISYWAAGSKKFMDRLFEKIDDTSINALVIDIKNEYGNVQFKSNSSYAENTKAHYNRTIKDLSSFVAKMKEKNIYLIGRMVIFKDNIFASKNIQHAIKKEDGSLWKNKENLSWTDPFSKVAHNYNIDIAEDIAKMGFDEIQFDYIRFPTIDKLKFSKANTLKNRVAAIESFLKDAKERLKPYNIFTSADVFGYACLNSGDTGIGQDLPTMQKHVDILAPMLYPSGYNVLKEFGGTPVEKPKETIYFSLISAQKNKNISPKKLRPWLQAFRDYSYDKRHFGKKEILAQIEATDEFGASGWMLWHPSSRYNMKNIVDDKPIADDTFKIAAIENEHEDEAID